jgi:hypothetical protein
MCPEIDISRTRSASRQIRKGRRFAPHAALCKRNLVSHRAQGGCGEQRRHRSGLQAAGSCNTAGQHSAAAGAGRRGSGPPHALLRRLFLCAGRGKALLDIWLTAPDIFAVHRLLRLVQYVRPSTQLHHQLSLRAAAACAALQPCAQVLLTQDNLGIRSQYLNARNTFTELFAYGTVPIVNENDTVAVEQVRFGDNDTLSAQVGIACTSFLSAAAPPAYKIVTDSFHDAGGDTSASRLALPAD